MPDHDTLELLELAERDVPFCPTCGDPTALRAHADGSVWLECSVLVAPQTGMRRLLRFAVPHFRRQVLTAD
jgi:hypothetical protein